MKELEQFVNHLGYKVYTELKSLLKTRSIGVKTVIFDKEYKNVVLVRHRYKGENRWYLPGGGVQVGERPDEALLRELTEEIIIDVSNPQLYGIFRSTIKRGDLVFLFYCQAGNKVSRAPFSEIEEVRYFGMNVLPTNLASGVDKRIRDALVVAKEGNGIKNIIIWGEW